MISKSPPEGFIPSLLKSGVNISHETVEKLIIYYDLLANWQKKINLIGSNTIQNVWERHFLDSLQLLKLIPKSAGIADIGSGAGFPGMALAIAGMENVHLIEKDTKKIAFLKEVARASKTNALIHHSRIEDMPVLNVDIITARAFAPLGTLLGYVAPQVSHGTICLFPKGKNWSMEIEDAKKRWLFDYSTISSATDNEGMILKLTHIEKRAP